MAKAKKISVVKHRKPVVKRAGKTRRKPTDSRWNKTEVVGRLFDALSQRVDNLTKRVNGLERRLG